MKFNNVQTRFYNNTSKSRYYMSFSVVDRILNGNTVIYNLVSNMGREISKRHGRQRVCILNLIRFDKDESSILLFNNFFETEQ